MRNHMKGWHEISSQPPSCKIFAEFLPLFCLQMQAFLFDLPAAQWNKKSQKRRGKKNPYNSAARWGLIRVSPAASARHFSSARQKRLSSKLFDLFTEGRDEFSVTTMVQSGAGGEGIGRGGVGWRRGRRTPHRAG